jgi:hypothetical protein
MCPVVSALNRKPRPGGNPLACAIFWNCRKEAAMVDPMSDPPHTDPADQDPRERDLARRSGGPAISLWLVIGVIVLLALAVYVISAVLV